MKAKIKVILEDFESQITERDNTIGEMQESINIYTDKILALIDIVRYDNNDCDATEIDIY